LIRLTLWMRGRSNIRRLRIVALSIVIGNGIIIVLADDHLPGDLLRLGLLTIPMIRGAYLMRDCFLNIHLSGIGTVPVAVPLLILDHAPGPKATIVAGVAAGAQVETIQASTAGPVIPVNLVANGNIKIDQAHVKNVNDENIKKGRERKTRRQVGKRRKGMKKDGAS